MSNDNAFERKITGTRGTTWSFRFFMLTINFLFFYLIVDFDFFYWGTIIFAGFMFITTIFNWLKNRSNRALTGVDDPIDIGLLIQKYLRINRKFMLATILGLMLAATIIAHYGLVTHNFRSDVYDSKLGSNIIPSYQATFGFSDNTDYTKMLNDLEVKFNESVLDEGLTPYTSYLGFEADFGLVTKQSIDYTRISLLTPEIFDFISKNPSFSPSLSYTENLKIFIQPIWWQWENIDLENGNELILYDWNTDKNITVEVDYVWKPTDAEFNQMYSEVEGIWRIIDRGILVSHEYQLDFFNELNISRNPDTVSFFGYIDQDSFTQYEADEILNKLQNIEGKMNTATYLFPLLYYTDSQVAQNLEYFQIQLRLLLFTIFLLSMPMIVVALFLVYFSVNLVEQRKSRLVAIMKIRGISRNQLMLVLIAETLIAGIIATIAGMLLSIIWTQNDIAQGFITLSSNATFSIPPSWYWKIPLLTIILAVDLNMASIRTISSTTVEEGEESIEKKEPFWRRWYLDVFIFGVSMVYWISMQVIPMRDILRQILIGLSPIMLGFFIIGTPLFISRYFANFISIASEILWRKQGGILALATRNMRKNRFSASRLATLLMLGMMLSFTALAIPQTLNSWNQEQAYYNTGADIYISGLDRSNQTLFSAFQIDGIESYTEVAYKSAYSRSQIQIMGVNSSSFADVAYWNRDYAKSSLNKLMEKIGDNKSLIESTALSFLSLDIGDEYLFQFDSSSIDLGAGDNLNMRVKISGTFDQFPTHVTYLWSWDNWIDPVYLVMDIVDMNRTFSDLDVGVLVKVAEGENQTKIALDLAEIYTNETKISVRGADLSAQAFLEDSTTKFLFSFAFSLLVVTAIASIIAVGYFSFITLAERRKEIGVFRAVGMVGDQIFVLLVIEILVIILTAILIGVVTGLFLASNIFLLFGDVSFGTYPPMKVKYPIIQSLGFVIITIVISVAAAAIPARITSRKQTGSILRED